MNLYKSIPLYPHCLLKDMTHPQPLKPPSQSAKVATILIFITTDSFFVLLNFK